jgi:hypothetical protein
VPIAGASIPNGAHQSRGRGRGFGSVASASGAEVGGVRLIIRIVAVGVVAVARRLVARKEGVEAVAGIGFRQRRAIIRGQPRLRRRTRVLVQEVGVAILVGRDDLLRAGVNVDVRSASALRHALRGRDWLKHRRCLDVLRTDAGRWSHALGKRWHQAPSPTVKDSEGESGANGDIDERFHGGTPRGCHHHTPNPVPVKRR